MDNSRLLGRTILVVDDEPLLCLEAVATLTACGAHAISACRVADAIKAVDHHPITAAVLDIDFGEEDPSALCQHLSQRHIPFAFYTGYTTAPDGWRDVPIITKPAHPSQVVEVVERLCGLHQQAV